MSQNEAPSPRRTWRQVAADAAKETDHQELLELIGELIQLLEEEQKQVSEQVSPQKPPTLVRYGVCDDVIPRVAYGTRQQTPTTFLDSGSLSKLFTDAASRGTVFMEIHIVEEVCSELKQLLKQPETLRAQTVEGLTEVGLLEYQQRYDVERLTRRKPIAFDQFARDYAFAIHDEAKVAS